MASPPHQKYAPAIALLACALAATASAHDPPRGRSSSAQEIAAHRLEDFGFDGFVELNDRLQRDFDGYTNSNGVLRAPAVLDSEPAQLTPATTGAWSAVFDAPLVPIHISLLPNGRLLFWDSISDIPAAKYHDPQNTTRMAVWDPATNAFTRVDTTTGYNLFCSGLAHLPDGTVLVAGGNKDHTLAGLDTVHFFDPMSQTWTLSPAVMGGGRWYPSVTPLANGEMLITSGGYDTPEVFTPDVVVPSLGVLRPLTDAVLSLPLYPWLHASPGGRAFNFGPADALRYLDTAGTGAWEGVGKRGDGLKRSYGSFGLYDLGKVIVAGGGPSSRSARVVSFLYSDRRPQTAATGDLVVGRRQHNLTVLPDGSVLATGGNSSGTPLVDLKAPVLNAERWNPATGTWQLLAAAQRTRQYHSTAILLPDARVLSGGGGICGKCQALGYIEKNFEIFSPPYLFAADGSTAPRPQIGSAPETVHYDNDFFVATPSPLAIASVVLMRMASVTHSVDFEQRRVPLRFTATTGGLIVRAVPNANLAPPGYYMLFLNDTAGVPSVARIVHLSEGGSLGAPLALLPSAARRVINLPFVPVPGASSYEVRYGTSPAELTNIVSVASTPQAVASIPNLHPGTQYYLGIYAKNGSVTGGFSNVVTISTLP